MTTVFSSVNNNCVFLNLTESCNLLCSHCYVNAGPRIGNHMPMKVVKRALDLFMQLGINDVRLIGGEPTIHPEFEAVLDYAKDMGVSLGLVSNGVKYLNSTRALEIYCKFSRIWISVYGPSANRHAFISGRSIESFYTTIRMVGKLACEKNQIGLSVLICPGDEKHIDQLIDIASTAGIKKLRLLPIQPDGRGRNVQTKWHAWPEEVAAIAQILKTHKLASQFSTLSINNPFNLTGQFEDSFSSCLLLHRRMWTVVPSGKVYRCCFDIGPDSQWVCNIMDTDALGKLQYPPLLPPMQSCRGITNSFWPDITANRLTCPISSINPKHIV